MHLNTNVSYYCAYYAVAYFVFRRENQTGITQPIMQVDEMETGNSISQWLAHNGFVGEMMTHFNNDN